MCPLVVEHRLPHHLMVQLGWGQSSEMTSVAHWLHHLKVGGSGVTCAAASVPSRVDGRDGTQLLLMLQLPLLPPLPPLQLLAHRRCLGCV